MIKPLGLDRHPIDVSVLALTSNPATGPVVPRQVAGVSDPVARAQAGDPDAFEAVYRAHVGRVHALALRLTGDPGAAAELTQDTFIRAWEALASFRGESALGSWLHRLAVNTFLGGLRRTQRRERRVVLSADPSLLERQSAERIPAARLDLERAIASLPERARLVFVLHDVEGYQHGEIGAMTGIAVGTSKAQLFRARRLLREALER